MFVVTPLIDLAPVYHAARRHYPEVAEWIDHDSKESHPTVAVAEIGTIGYYSEANIVDYWGLLDPRANEFIRRGDMSFWLSSCSISSRDFGYLRTLTGGGHRFANSGRSESLSFSRARFVIFVGAFLLLLPKGSTCINDAGDVFVPKVRADREAQMGACRPFRDRESTLREPQVSEGPREVRGDRIVDQGLDFVGRQVLLQLVAGVMVNDIKMPHVIAVWTDLGQVQSRDVG